MKTISFDSQIVAAIDPAWDGSSGARGGESSEER
jgi:hypothetical protein